MPRNWRQALWVTHRFNRAFDAIRQSEGDGGNSRSAHRAEHVQAVQTIAREGRVDPAAS
jgi:hypothetical protein